MRMDPYGSPPSHSARGGFASGGKKGWGFGYVSFIVNRLRLSCEDKKQNWETTYPMDPVDHT